MACLANTIVCRLLINNIILISIGLGLLFSCISKQEQAQDELPFYNTPEFDAEWISRNEARYAKIHTISSFSLTDQQGHLINKDSLSDHIYVANFFFSICPVVCPKMMKNLQALQNTFATDKQVFLVSFSVMPWVDSVARLHEYGKAHHINPAKWHLLTGRKETIYDLARKSYFAEKGVGLQKNNAEFLHTESMFLIDKKARIRGIYNATQPADIDRITEDIQLLLKEKTH